MKTKLKQIREEMNYLQKEMAELINQTTSSYSRKENNKRALGLSEAIIIANKYYDMTGKCLNISELI